MQAAGGADEGATGAEAGDEVGDAAGGLFPDFVGGAAIVRLPVGRIAVLIGIEIFFGIGGDHFLHFADRAVGAFVAGSDDEFGSECAENFLTLVRSAVRQAQGDSVAECGGDHGVGNAGVAAGGVDDALARCQLAGGQAGLDHAQGRAILDGAAGVEPFGLGGELDVGVVAADPLQAQKGRVADEVEDGAAGALSWGLTEARIV